MSKQSGMCQVVIVGLLDFLDQISQGFGDFYAPNHFSGLTDSANQWHFKNHEGNWKIPSDPNDVQVSCID